MNPINHTLVRALFECYLEVSDRQFAELCWMKDECMLSIESVIALESILALAND